MTKMLADFDQHGSQSNSSPSFEALHFEVTQNTSSALSFVLIVISCVFFAIFIVLLHVCVCLCELNSQRHTKAGMCTSVFLAIFINYFLNSNIFADNLFDAVFS